MGFEGKALIVKRWYVIFCNLSVLNW